jgi:putative IMPACT (imprinted ancient) family translation regulator
MLSRSVTDCLIVVVRYFGGTKLGVSGLIAAYREAAAEVLAASVIVERTVNKIIRIEFPYIAMNDIMRIIKEEQPEILSQNFDNICTMELSIRESKAERLIKKVENGKWN